MKISKMFKRIASMGMALAMAMSCAAISAGAADTDTTKYTVTADVYVAKADNYIKLVDAHLTDTAVPPINAPEQNGTLEKVDDGYNVTVTLNNETFELKTIADTSAATDDKTATVVSTDSVTSKSGKRIQTITFFVPELDKVYKFDATEYVNKHVFTIGNTGDKTLPISVKISSDLVEVK